MITIVDYGVGNLFSLKSSFGFLGQEVQVTGDADKVAKADKIILPGVGAFGDAADKLRALHMDEAVCEAVSRGVPMMGICLGMQMLFDESVEYGVHKGLGLIPGRVVPMRGVIPADYKIPHIGWNALRLTDLKSPLFRNVREGDCVYFVHSFYAAACEPFVTAYAEYGALLTAAVEKDNVMGCQFHPEKSGRVGLNILQAFCDV